MSVTMKKHTHSSEHAWTHTCVRAQQTHQRAWQEVQLSEMNKQPLHRKKAGQKIKPACMFPQGVYVCVCVHMLTLMTLRNAALRRPNCCGSFQSVKMSPKDQRYTLKVT